MTDILLPPLRAQLSVLATPMNSEEFTGKLQALRLRTNDLQPIDWRKNSPAIGGPINQRNCGDCWAVSSCGALSDRFRIQNGNRGLVIDPAFVQCIAGATYNKVCNGGWPYLAFKFFELEGVPDVFNTCPAWQNFCDEKNCNVLTCEEMKKLCLDNIRYRAKNVHTTMVKDKTGAVDAEATIDNMKLELTKGPFPACFFVPRDFYVTLVLKTPSNNFKGYKWEATNGVYIQGEYNADIEKLIDELTAYKASQPKPIQNLKQKTYKQFGVTNSNDWSGLVVENGQPAGHAVEIVGWDYYDSGKYGKIPCWIVKNSWGTDWAEDGYYRIAMNDPRGNSKGLKFNSQLAFDVPVLSSNTDDRSGQAGFFGSGTSFDIDQSSGRPRNFSYETSSVFKSKNPATWVIIILLLTCSIAGIFYLIKKYLLKKLKK